MRYYNLKERAPKTGRDRQSGERHVCPVPDFKRLATLWLICLCLVATPVVAEPSLYVYVPSNLRPYAVQERLSHALPDLKPVVFGRIRDFLAQVEANDPEGILVLPPVLDHLPGYQSIIKGIRSGSTSTKYVLVSIGKPVNDRKDLTVGVVDFLGGEQMTAYVRGLMRNNEAKVKRVAREEDLLALLRFETVDAVLVLASNWDGLKEQSKLDFAVTELPEATVGLPTVAVQKGYDAVRLKQQLTAMNSEIFGLFGIDGWAK